MLTRLGEWLLALIYGRDAGREIAADLQEERSDIARRAGRGAARRWYWRQIARSVAARPLDMRTPGPPRDRRAAGGWSGWRRDLVSAGRLMHRRPSFAAAVAGTLALGIGLNAAIFPVVDFALLRALPYPAADRLVAIGTASPDLPDAFSTEGFARIEAAMSFSAVTAYSVVTRVFAADGAPPEHVGVARTIGEFTKTMGVAPARGRTFGAAETRQGAPVLLISDRLWRTGFDANPEAVGRTARIDGETYTVVGVMPPGFRFPDDVDAWRPRTLEERADPDAENTAVGRLGPDVTPARAQSEVGGRVMPLGERRGLENRSALAALQAAALLVLLVACLNLAGLFVAEGSRRKREMALRSALGASRWRLARQVAIEGLLLAACGGAGGLLLGSWALHVVVGAAPASVPRLEDVAMDGRIIAIGAVATLVAGVVVVVLPAIRLARPDLSAVLGPATVAGGGSRARRWLVAGQVAVAVVVAISAGLLARTLHSLTTVDHGFDPAGLIAVDLSLRGVELDDPAVLFAELEAAAASVPGVFGAAVAFRLPTETRGPSARVTVRGLPASEDVPPTVLRPVTPGYFDLVGLPITAGRGFLSTDRRGGPGVAIANEAFVRIVLAGRPPLGLVVELGRGLEPVTIVGRTIDVTPRGDAEEPALYFPMSQLAIGGGALLARIDERASPIAAMTARLREAAPLLPFDRAHALSDDLAASQDAARLNAVLAAVFGGLSLLIAMVGVHGLTSQEVSSRRRETGIRLALGASRPGAVWTVARSAVQAVVIGLVAGLGGAIWAGRAIGSLLVGVPPIDPLTFTTAISAFAALGVGTAVAASVSATRVDPARTLRGD